MNDTDQSQQNAPEQNGSFFFHARQQSPQHRLPTTFGNKPPPTHRRAKAPLIFFLIVLLIMLSITLFLLEYQRRSKPPITAQPVSTPAIVKEQEQVVKIPVPPPAGEATTAVQPPKIITPTPPKITPSNPFDIIVAVGNALAKSDFPTAERLIGEPALTPQIRVGLRELATIQPVKLKPSNAVREVGELEINQRLRIALELDERQPGYDRIYFDLNKEADGWKVITVILPPAKDQAAKSMATLDALGVVDAFLLATLQQNFAHAKEFVNTTTVTDATIAGLCILFEEGNYKLRPQKPLRATLQKETITTFLAYLVSPDDSQSAQFGITLRKETPQSGWVIDELNLDQLLGDYAKRVAGGDVHYTPLIKNPNGGETLVLYFDFDTNELTERTKRQLAVVAMLLKSDPNKKINLSGHTDSLGSRSYNQSLSKLRALAVKDFLVESGVAIPQIITAAKGLTEPRRPNVTESGLDDPDGRRANRRTEIYLDF